MQQLVDGQAAAGDEQHVYLVLNGLGKLYDFLDLGRALDDVGAAQAVFNGYLVAALTADGVEQLNGEAAPVLEVLGAVLVGALVEHGVEEQGGELAVGTVDVDDVGAGEHGVAGGDGVVLDELLYLIVGEDVDVDVHRDADGALDLVGAEVGGDGHELYLGLGAPPAGGLDPLGQGNDNVGVAHAGDVVAGGGELFVDEAAAHGDNRGAALGKGDDGLNALAGDVVVIACHEIPLRSAGDTVFESYAAVTEL